MISLQDFKGDISIKPASEFSASSEISFQIELGIL